MNEPIRWTAVACLLMFLAGLTGNPYAKGLLAYFAGLSTGVALLSAALSNVESKRRAGRG